MKVCGQLNQAITSAQQGQNMHEAKAVRNKHITPDRVFVSGNSRCGGAGAYIGSPL